MVQYFGVKVPGITFVNNQPQSGSVDFSVDSHGKNQKFVSTLSPLWGIIQSRILRMRIFTEVTFQKPVSGKMRFLEAPYNFQQGVIDGS